MFIEIDHVLYVTDPGDQKACKLLSYTKEKELLPVRVALVLAVAGLFFAPGLLMAVLAALFSHDAHTIFASLIVLLLCVVGGLALGRAAIAITRERQKRQFERYTAALRILKLPGAIGNHLISLATAAQCRNYIAFYRPDPYDLADLKALTKEHNDGLRSSRHVATRVIPTLASLVGKIRNAQYSAEQESAHQAEAMRNFNRPTDEGG